MVTKILMTIAVILNVIIWFGLFQKDYFDDRGIMDFIATLFIVPILSVLITIVFGFPLYFIWR